MDTNKEIEFECSQCGECCRNLNNSEIYKFLDRGDGICKYLNGNLCSIYNRRPLLCRVGECYEKFFSSKLSREEYYKVNYAICSALKKNRG